MTEPAHGLFGPGIFGTGIDLSALDEDTAFRLGQFVLRQVEAGQKIAYREGFEAGDINGYLRAIAALRDRPTFTRWVLANLNKRRPDYHTGEIAADYLEHVPPAARGGLEDTADDNA